MLYPQNGDRIVAIDSVTSLHPVYCWRKFNVVFFSSTDLEFLYENDTDTRRERRFHSFRFTAFTECAAEAADNGKKPTTDRQLHGWKCRKGQRRRRGKVGKRGN